MAVSFSLPLSLSLSCKNFLIFSSYPLIINIITPQDEAYGCRCSESAAWREPDGGSLHPSHPRTGGGAPGMGQEKGTIQPETDPAIGHHQAIRLHAGRQKVSKPVGQAFGGGRGGGIWSCILQLAWNYRILEGNLK